MFEEYGMAKDLSGSGEAADFDNEEEDEVAIRQTKNLRRFRLFFIIAIFAVALGLALAIYFLTHNQEVNAFSATFYDRADKIVTTFHVRLDQNVGALESLSFSMTSYAMFTNKIWPFVTVPDYEVRGASTRSLANSVSLTFSPMVESPQRQDWESYSVQNREWVEQGLAFEQNFGMEQVQDRRLQTANTDVISYIDKDGNRVPVEDNGPYFPAWQSSPVAERMINLDLNSTKVFSTGIEAVMERGKAILGSTYDESNLDATMKSFQDSWSEGDSKFYEGEGPVVVLFFPVYDELEPSVRTPKGILTSMSFWESFMHRVLPSDQGGLDVVIQSECGDSHTYRVHGDTVSYVGPGDQHNQDFNDISVTSTVAIVDGPSDTYHGVQLQDICKYSVTLYPTQGLYDEYVTATPWFFFALVLAIFFLTTLIIFFYDWKVEKNYQETYRKAKQAGAIVSSIFPAAVRRRLYEEDNSASNSKVKGQGAFKQAVPVIVDSQKNRLKGFLKEETPATEGDAHHRRAPTGNDDDEMRLEPKKNMEKAIADLFPETTILFADIVGFTAWSSQRCVLSATILSFRICAFWILFFLAESPEKFLLYCKLCTRNSTRLHDNSKFSK